MSSYTIRVIMGVETTVTAGAPGRGVPPGGTTGQVLAKASGGSFDTEWVDPSGGPGGSGDVVGPASSVDGRMAVFAGTSGKLLAQGTKTGAEVAGHIDSTANPHATTAAQVGADPAGTAAAAVSAHSGAADPHGDRDFATAAISTHAAAASAHGISGVDGLAAALALLAPLLSPALTGTPTSPTAAPGTSSTQIATTAFVAAAVAALINSAPGALDTLDELAAALGDDPNFAATITAALAGKLTKASNLSDLTDAAAARGNLGAGTVGGQVFTAATAAAIRTLLNLGGAALLDIGTGAGTAAAGDHNHASLYAALAHASTHAPGGADALPWTTIHGRGLASARPAAAASNAGHVYYSTDTQALERSNGSAWESIAPAGVGGGASNTRWIGAGELIPRVTAGAGIDGEELATNDINLDYLAYDAATSEGAHVAFSWPSGFSTFTATFHWTAGSGSGGVRWQASARCYADDDALDQAQGTSQAVSDTLLAANDAHKSGATAAITPGGTVAAGNLCVVEIERDPSHSDDTLAVDARLIGVHLEFAA